MKTILFILMMIGAGASYAQALRDINYNYQYDPTEFSFNLKAVRSGEQWTIFYKLQLIDTTFKVDDFSLQWEKRQDLNEKEGTLLSPEELSLTILQTDKYKQSGKITISQNSKILVVKVTSIGLKRSWLFYNVLDSKYPVNAYLRNGTGDVIFEPYISPGKPVALSGFSEGNLLISYYDDFFPAAAVAFSEGQAKVAKRMNPDSTFTIKTDEAVTFNKRGLYLVQKDTNSMDGIAFRVEDDYPKFKRLQDLTGPFIYITSREESAKLKQAGTDKKKFDKVVLDMTRDNERAKDFMRNYFRRVELVNQYFTSYKEGWKTDRGMVYMVYGKPDKVYKFLDREVWSYGKTTFNFIRSSTLFDPDNYVLIRNKKYTKEWYEQVDLVRNSRF